MEGLTETMKDLSQNSRYPGRDLKLESHEYEVGVSNIKLQRPVSMLL
jgi:hypothetical protein